MTAARVFRRAAEAFASRPGGHEMQQLALAAIEWSREWRRERDRKPGKAEPREDSRGSFAGLARGPDGTLEPAPFRDRDPFVDPPPCAVFPGWRCKSSCERGLGPNQCARKAGGVTHGYAPDAMPAGLRKACDARFTVYGSAGPYRPTNPEDDGA